MSDVKPYYETMPKFEFGGEVMAYLQSRGETLEQHEHLPVPNAWDDNKWVCEVPGCSWAVPVDEDEVEPTPDLYTRPEVQQLTDIICESIHREVCEMNVTTADGHAVGDAHRACETNFRHGAVAWLYMGQPRTNRLRAILAALWEAEIWDEFVVSDCFDDSDPLTVDIRAAIG